ncbi:DUF6988 family protein [Pseudomonas lini]
MPGNCLCFWLPSNVDALYAATDQAIQKLTAPPTVESERVANKLPQVSDMVDAIVKKHRLRRRPCWSSSKTCLGLL